MTLLKTYHIPSRYLIVAGAAVVIGLSILAVERFGGPPGRDADLPLARQSAIVLLGGKAAPIPAPPAAGASIAVSPRRPAGPLHADGDQPAKSGEASVDR